MAILLLAGLNVSQRKKTIPPSVSGLSGTKRERKKRLKQTSYPGHETQVKRNVTQVKHKVTPQIQIQIQI
ncbi:hypothetical protein AIE71_02990 [Salmonella enterica subsp. enterica]|nr:hypothetical protein [Salmonella enterica subsp. enterica]